MAYTLVRHGVLPTGLAAVVTMKDEGASALHWKALGDALVRFFQNAGPVFTKFGQILATRSDLFPETVCTRLERLYTKQPAMPKAQLLAALKIAYRGYPATSPFERFEFKALAVGSIGQVHRATLRDGTPVIVKIIRPGIAREVERDLTAAHTLMTLFFALPMRGKKANKFMLRKALEDLSSGFRTEIDLNHEADSLEDFGRRFRRNPNVCVPKCFRKLSSKGVLVMEELIGEPLSKYRERAKSNPEAAKRVASLALKEILNQIFIEGRFHGDPHAGNLLVLADGRLGLIDLGLTGEFGRADRKNIARAVRAFTSRDADKLIRALLGFGATPDDFDFEAFKADVIKIVQGHKGKVAQQVSGKLAQAASSAGNSLEDFVNALFSAAYRHKIYVPAAATLLIKTLVTIEGVARSLDPEINLVAAAAPVILKSLTPAWLRWGFWAG